jgi:uncharacterized protein YbaP (TraB family)
MIKAMRILVGAAALLMASACASAPEAPAPSAFAPALFVARDADSTIYLYGTIHLRRPGGDWGGENAKAALASAEELWTEMILGPETDAAVQQLVFAHGFSPDRPLSSRLTADEFARLTEVVEGLGLPVAHVDAMRPWLAALTLAMLPMREAGYDPAHGIDEAINAAAGDAMPRHAFETAEQQMGFFANMSEDVQMQMLRDAMDDAAQGAELLDEMSLAWERGDLAALDRLLVDEFKAEAPEAYDVIFTRRNLAWTNTLMAELEGSGVDFIAVGAGHLVGDEGLVALLRARGVQVERVN